MTAPSFESSQTLDNIVRQAEALDEDERLPYLRRVCADDRLLEQAIDILRHSSPQWWDHSIESSAHDSSGSTRARIGEAIGPYRIVRALGEGGMGEVLLAERDDRQFRQQVAIKLVRGGTPSRNVQGRLKIERQILATLNHPNIARLLDGGTTAEGTPYIVMEYIEGEPIDVYCDRKRLDIEQRLRLFRDVCAAVHCAHQNLIVHRDLKPSNILVTADGSLKLLDFGIAKLLDDRNFINTMAVTQMDVRVMTPEHASPEQIRGDPLTTASDTYALGVLLYFLLAGHKPYDLRTQRLSEIEAAILEQPPLALDAWLNRSTNDVGEEINRLCAARSSTEAKLRRQLRGDLEVIVNTALRKEPERRYASVEQFSSDIERYLRGMPIAARKDDWQYRAVKFIRRHRIGVGASALFVAGLAAFAVVTTLQAQRIAREQARAEHVSSFLIEMFKQADPSHSRGKEITVREVLDAGSRRIVNALEQQPEIRANLLATVGEVYKGLGLYENSEQLLRDALNTRKRILGPDHPEMAGDLVRLGEALVLREKIAEADVVLTDAFATSRRLHGADSVDTAKSLRELGMLKRRQQQLVEAESNLRESVRILKNQTTPPYLELSKSLNSLAILLDAKGDNAGAEHLYRESLAATKTALGEDHPATAYALHNLAVELQKQGKLVEAEPHFAASLRLYRSLFGAEHPETLAALANYGSFLHRKQEFDKAETIYREVLQLDRKVRGESHSYVGYDHVNLGLLLHDRRRYSEAEAEYRAGLRIYALAATPNNQYEAAARRSLGITLVALDRTREAEQELRKAVGIFSKTLSDDHPQLATSQGALGYALVKQRRFAEAESLLIQSYESLQRSRGSDNPGVVRMRTWIEELYHEWGKPERAKQFFDGLQPAPTNHGATAKAP